MVRDQSLDEPLFYAQHEIAQPSEHNLYVRLMRSRLDWRKLAEPFEGAFSAGMGRPTDPVVYLKIFLVSYFENITYDTDLAERIGDSIAIRRFLGYNLSEQTPDHSSISRNRGKIADSCDVDDVLFRVVEECIKVGLVDGDLSAVDSTLVPANASLSSLVSAKTGKSVREHLREVAERNKIAATSGEKKKKAEVSNEEFVSTTDPDARIAKKDGKPKDMYYKVTHVTDSKGGIILATGCAYADTGEREAAEPVIEDAVRVLSRRRLALKRLAADAGYDGSDFAAFVEGLGTEPAVNYRPDTCKIADGFRKESFTYDKERNCYICPMGCSLRFFRSDPGRMRYISNASDCAVCPYKHMCIGDKDIRWLSRRDNEESRERNIARCHSDEGRAVLKARKHIVEPPFGHMKTYGGLSMINCRGKAKAEVKAVMAAVAYDIIKLLRAMTKRKKEAASAVLGVVGLAGASKAAEVCKIIVHDAYFTVSAAYKDLIVALRRVRFALCPI